MVAIVAEDFQANGDKIAELPLLELTLCFVGADKICQNFALNGPVSALIVF